MAGLSGDRGTQDSSKDPGSGMEFSGLGAVYPDTAGIDIGAESHHVSVPEDRDEHPVREFGCYTSDLSALGDWLKECGVKTVVMESTGVYWIPTYRVLQEQGFEVQLVDARHAKHVPGRKTDVWDCQWLRQLHTYGLLRGCFIPPQEIQVVRTYWRHRTELVQSCAQQIHLMQKALEQMNVQLHKAVSDITGVTGMGIIRAIVSGEHDPVVLAQMRQRGVKKSEEELAKALTGHYSAEHLFTLGQALATYDFHQEQIRECDEKLAECMSRFEDHPDGEEGTSECCGPTGGTRRKNQPHFDLAGELVRISGVDLTQIDGISALTAQVIFSEVGYDLTAFPTEKHFASWLALCPNPRKTGGRVRSSRTRPSRNRVATALRVAAQSLHRSKSGLGAYFRRLRGRLGAPKAITATAHRLALLVYRLLRHKKAYVDGGEEAYQQRLQEQQLARVQREAARLGYVLLSPATGEIAG